MVQSSQSGANSAGRRVGRLRMNLVSGLSGSSLGVLTLFSILVMWSPSWPRRVWELIDDACSFTHTCVASVADRPFKDRCTATEVVGACTEVSACAVGCAGSVWDPGMKASLKVEVRWLLNVGHARAESDLVSRGLCLDSVGRWPASTVLVEDDDDDDDDDDEADELDDDGDIAYTVTSE